VDGSGISWTVCKQYAPRSRQTTTPTPHHSIFTGRMPFLTSNQQCQSTEDKPSQQTTSATNRFLLVCRSCETVFSSSAPGRFLHHRKTCKLKAKFHYTGPTGPTRTLSETHTNPTEFFWRPGLQKSSCGSGQARVVEFSYNHTIQLAMLTAASTLQQYHQCNYTPNAVASIISVITHAGNQLETFHQSLSA